MPLITAGIIYYRSTYFEINVDVTPSSNLTATKALFTVKTVPYDDSGSDTTALIKKDVNLNNNAGVITIEKNDVADTVAPGKYHYSIHIIMSDGKPYPFAIGKFELKATTTNRDS